jgi:hypothetical protein
MKLTSRVYDCFFAHDVVVVVVVVVIVVPAVDVVAFVGCGDDVVASASTVTATIVVGFAHVAAYTSSIDVADVVADVPYVAFVVAPDIDPDDVADATDVVDVDVVVVVVDDVDPVGGPANADIVVVVVVAAAVFFLMMMTILLVMLFLLLMSG